MKIGVIGTGNIGGTLARKLIAAGHQVRVANSRGLEGVRPFADEIGAEAVDIRGAVDGAELIILAIPLAAIARLPKSLFESTPGTVPIVSTSNYYPELGDPRIPEIDAGQVESIWVSQQLGLPVIKAFNNILAYSLAELSRPQGAEDRLAVAVAGEDVEQKRIVMGLVNETGFDPVDGGSLDDSWRQQPSTPAYCCDWGAETMRRALPAAVENEAPRKRAQLPEQFGTLGENPTHSDIVALNRSLNWPD
ncbi:NADPH-dependent F420 reductase [Aliidiomarina soli]|uniref:3-hydroxyisobutyrate dehydrogenase n=1 Tax=Aliidiomarina soli TaxID=1928574 RepID=A0A432WJ92_9GAMM|nr:NAD(P)-binding domain-containing protein [Aliidiomarina soli]RUO33791.1 3-hydroxyisobutyrate dehydrogenase [Aliidiomarina soli]